MCRKAICNVEGCHCEGVVKVDLARRGGRSVWLCREHAEHMNGYNYENQFTLGTPNKTGYTYGIELETSFSNLKARAEILANKYIPTSDITVDVEYKSPIMQGLNSLSKQLVSYDKLIQNGDLEINNTCGTHFHVGNVDYINGITIDYVKRFYHSLFVELSNLMLDNNEKTERLFGRKLGESNSLGWANAVNTNTHPDDHRNFINCQHTYSLEFRLCKFQNAKQYMNCVKFCDKIAKIVVENFIKHFNDTDIDNSRYSNMTEYRKHKAQVASRKICKAYLQAIENL